MPNKTRKQGMRMHKKCCEATMHGLNKWYETEFEKLGWMILAKSHGYNDKITAYMNSLHRLKQALLHKMTHVKESDRKDDLTIMCNNLDILLAHVQKDFN